MNNENKPREWVLRVTEDGQAHVYSGNEILFPYDDYLRVVDKKAYSNIKAQLKVAMEALEDLSKYEEGCVWFDGNVLVCNAFEEIEKIRREE